MLADGSVSMVWVVLFWVSSWLVVYPYVIYPILLFVLKGRPRSDSTIAASRDLPVTALPRVCLVVSAYNEAAVIKRKLDNACDLEYPPDKLEILVISDASNDGTDDIVAERASSDARVRLFRQEGRLGKTAGINAAMNNIDADIVVFSDANALYEPDALLELMRPFSEQSVGYVVGSALYVDGDETASQDSEGLYWKYELIVKQLESDFHCVVGGDGAIYAIRRPLYRPLKPEDINDFVNPLHIVAQGYRGVFTRRARCHEFAAEEFEREFSRKRRIVNRSWRAVYSYIHLFGWKDHGRFLFMLLSHKVVRWFSVFFVAVAVISNIAILIEHFSWFYATLLGVILLSLLLAMLGYVLDRRGRSMPRIVYLPYYFYFVGLASLLGVWDNLRGQQHVTWGHIRS